MFETPPLEINVLRKASSYAYEKFDRQLLNRSFDRLLRRKVTPSFLRSESRIGFLGTGAPKNPFPHQMEVPYARDNFLPNVIASAVPHTGNVGIAHDFIT